jgi:hypothetical protein
MSHPNPAAPTESLPNRPAFLSVKYEDLTAAASLGTTPSNVDNCTSPKQFARQVQRTASSEACSNWWPADKLLPIIAAGMPHPICRGCANWLGDIEEITVPSLTVAPTGCGNHWPSIKNTL